MYKKIRRFIARLTSFDGFAWSKYLQYIQIKLFTLSPNIELFDIPLPFNLFSLIDLPFSIIDSNISNLIISFSWSTLLEKKKVPINITCENIIIVIRIISPSEYNAVSINKYNNKKQTYVRSAFHLLLEPISELKSKLSYHIINLLNVHANQIKIRVVDNNIGGGPSFMDFIIDKIDINKAINSKVEDKHTDCVERALKRVLDIKLSTVRLYHKNLDNNIIPSTKSLFIYLTQKASYADKYYSTILNYFDVVFQERIKHELLYGTNKWSNEEINLANQDALYLYHSLIDRKYISTLSNYLCFCITQSNSMNITLHISNYDERAYIDFDVAGEALSNINANVAVDKLVFTENSLNFLVGLYRNYEIYSSFRKGLIYQINKPIDALTAKKYIGAIKTCYFNYTSVGTHKERKIIDDIEKNYNFYALFPYFIEAIDEINNTTTESNFCFSSSNTNVGLLAEKLIVNRNKIEKIFNDKFVGDIDQLQKSMYIWYSCYSKTNVNIDNVNIILIIDNLDSFFCTNSVKIKREAVNIINITLSANLLLYTWINLHNSNYVLVNDLHISKSQAKLSTFNTSNSSTTGNDAYIVLDCSKNYSYFTSSIYKPISYLQCKYSETNKKYYIDSDSYENKYFASNLYFKEVHDMINKNNCTFIYSKEHVNAPIFNYNDTNSNQLLTQLFISDTTIELFEFSKIFLLKIPYNKYYTLNVILENDIQQIRKTFNYNDTSNYFVDVKDVIKNSSVYKYYQTSSTVIHCNKLLTNISPRTVRLLIDKNLYNSELIQLYDIAGEPKINVTGLNNDFKNNITKSSRENLKNYYLSGYDYIKQMFEGQLLDNYYISDKVQTKKNFQYNTNNNKETSKNGTALLQYQTFVAGQNSLSEEKVANDPKNLMILKLVPFDLFELFFTIQNMIVIIDNRGLIEIKLDSAVVHNSSKIALQFNKINLSLIPTKFNSRTILITIRLLKVIEIDILINIINAYKEYKISILDFEIYNTISLLMRKIQKNLDFNVENYTKVYADSLPPNYKVIENLTKMNYISLDIFQYYLAKLYSEYNFNDVLKSDMNHITSISIKLDNISISVYDNIHMFLYNITGNYTYMKNDLTLLSVMITDMLAYISNIDKKAVLPLLSKQIVKAQKVTEDQFNMFDNYLEIEVNSNTKNQEHLNHYIISYNANEQLFSNQDIKRTLYKQHKSNESNSDTDKCIYTILEDNQFEFDFNDIHIPNNYINYSSILAMYEQYHSYLTDNNLNNTSIIIRSFNNSMTINISDIHLYFWSAAVLIFNNTLNQINNKLYSLYSNSMTYNSMLLIYLYDPLYSYYNLNVILQDKKTYNSSYMITVKNYFVHYLAKPVFFFGNLIGIDKLSYYSNNHKFKFTENLFDNLADIKYDLFLLSHVHFNYVIYIEHETNISINIVIDNLCYSQKFIKTASINSKKKLELYEEVIEKADVYTSTISFNKFFIALNTNATDLLISFFAAELSLDYTYVVYNKYYIAEVHELIMSNIYETDKHMLNKVKDYIIRNFGTYKLSKKILCSASGSLKAFVILTFCILSQRFKHNLENTNIGITSSFYNKNIDSITHYYLPDLNYILNECMLNFEMDKPYIISPLIWYDDRVHVDLKASKYVNNKFIRSRKSNSILNLTFNRNEYNELLIFGYLGCILANVSTANLINISILNTLCSSIYRNITLLMSKKSFESELLNVNKNMGSQKLYADSNIFQLHKFLAHMLNLEKYKQNLYFDEAIKCQLIIDRIEVISQCCYKSVKKLVKEFYVPLLSNNIEFPIYSLSTVLELYNANQSFNIDQLIYKPYYMETCTMNLKRYTDEFCKTLIANNLSANNLELKILIPYACINVGLYTAGHSNSILPIIANKTSIFANKSIDLFEEVNSFNVFLSILITGFLFEELSTGFRLSINNVEVFERNKRLILYKSLKADRFIYIENFKMLASSIYILFSYSLIKNLLKLFDICSLIYRIHDINSIVEIHSSVLFEIKADKLLELKRMISHFNNFWETKILNYYSNLDSTEYNYHKYNTTINRYTYLSSLLSIYIVENKTSKMIIDIQYAGGQANSTHKLQKNETDMNININLSGINVIVAYEGDYISTERLDIKYCMGDIEIESGVTVVEEIKNINSSNIYLKVFDTGNSSVSNQQISNSYNSSNYEIKREFIDNPNILKPIKQDYLFGKFVIPEVFFNSSKPVYKIENTNKRSQVSVGETTENTKSDRYLLHATIDFDLLTITIQETIIVGKYNLKVVITHGKIEEIGRLNIINNSFKIYNLYNKAASSHLNNKLVSLLSNEIYTYLNNTFIDLDIIIKNSIILNISLECLKKVFILFDNLITGKKRYLKYILKLHSVNSFHKYETNSKSKEYSVYYDGNNNEDKSYINYLVNFRKNILNENLYYYIAYNILYNCNFNLFSNTTHSKNALDITIDNYATYVKAYEFMLKDKLAEYNINENFSNANDLILAIINLHDCNDDHRNKYLKNYQLWFSLLSRGYRSNIYNLNILLPLFEINIYESNTVYMSVMMQAISLQGFIPIIGNNALELQTEANISLFDITNEYTKNIFEKAISLNIRLQRKYPNAHFSFNISPIIFELCTDYVQIFDYVYITIFHNYIKVIENQNKEIINDDKDLYTTKSLYSINESETSNNLKTIINHTGVDIAIITYSFNRLLMIVYLKPGEEYQYNNAADKLELYINRNSLFGSNNYLINYTVEPQMLAELKAILPKHLSCIIFNQYLYQLRTLIDTNINLSRKTDSNLNMPNSLHIEIKNVLFSNEQMKNNFLPIHKDTNALYSNTTSKVDSLLVFIQHKLGIFNQEYGKKNRLSIDQGWHYVATLKKNTVLSKNLFVKELSLNVYTYIDIEDSHMHIGSNVIVENNTHLNIRISYQTHVYNIDDIIKKSKKLNQEKLSSDMKTFINCLKKLWNKNKNTKGSKKVDKSNDFEYTRKSHNKESKNSANKFKFNNTYRSFLMPSFKKIFIPLYIFNNTKNKSLFVSLNDSSIPTNRFSQLEKLIEIIELIASLANNNQHFNSNLLNFDDYTKEITKNRDIIVLDKYSIKISISFDSISKHFKVKLNPLSIISNNLFFPLHIEHKFMNNATIKLNKSHQEHLLAIEHMHEITKFDQQPLNILYANDYLFDILIKNNTNINVIIPSGWVYLNYQNSAELVCNCSIIGKPINNYALIVQYSIPNIEKLNWIITLKQLLLCLYTNILSTHICKNTVQLYQSLINVIKAYYSINIKPIISFADFNSILDSFSSEYSHINIDSEIEDQRLTMYSNEINIKYKSINNWNYFDLFHANIHKANKNIAYTLNKFAFCIYHEKFADFSILSFYSIVCIENTMIDVSIEIVDESVVIPPRSFLNIETKIIQTQKRIRLILKQNENTLLLSKIFTKNIFSGEDCIYTTIIDSLIVNEKDHFIVYDLTGQKIDLAIYVEEYSFSNNCIHYLIHPAAIMLNTLTTPLYIVPFNIHNNTLLYDQKLLLLPNKEYQLLQNLNWICLLDKELEWCSTLINIKSLLSTNNYVKKDYKFTNIAKNDEWYSISFELFNVNSFCSSNQVDKVASSINLGMNGSTLKTVFKKRLIKNHTKFKYIVVSFTATPNYIIRNNTKQILILETRINLYNRNITNKLKMKSDLSLIFQKDYKKLLLYKNKTDNLVLMQLFLSSSTVSFLTEGNSDNTISVAKIEFLTTIDNRLNNMSLKNIELYLQTMIEKPAFLFIRLNCSIQVFINHQSDDPIYKYGLLNTSANIKLKLLELHNFNLPKYKNQISKNTIFMRNGLCLYTIIGHNDDLNELAMSKIDKSEYNGSQINISSSSISINKATSIDAKMTTDFGEHSTSNNMLAKYSKSNNISISKLPSQNLKLPYLAGKENCLQLQFNNLTISVELQEIVIRYYKKRNLLLSLLITKVNFDLIIENTKFALKHSENVFHKFNLYQEAVQTIKKKRSKISAMLDRKNLSFLSRRESNKRSHSSLLKNDSTIFDDGCHKQISINEYSNNQCLHFDELEITMNKIHLIDVTEEELVRLINDEMERVTLLNYNLFNSGTISGTITIKNITFRHNVQGDNPIIFVFNNSLPAKFKNIKLGRQKNNSILIYVRNDIRKEEYIKIYRDLTIVTSSINANFELETLNDIVTELEPDYEVINQTYFFKHILRGKRKKNKKSHVNIMPELYTAYSKSLLKTHIDKIHNFSYAYYCSNNLMILPKPDLLPLTSINKFYLQNLNISTIYINFSIKSTIREYTHSIFWLVQAISIDNPYIVIKFLSYSNHNLFTSISSLIKLCVSVYVSKLVKQSIASALFYYLASPITSLLKGAKEIKILSNELNCIEGIRVGISLMIIGFFGGIFNLIHHITDICYKIFNGKRRLAKGVIDGIIKAIEGAFIDIAIYPWAMLFQNNTAKNYKVFLYILLKLLRCLTSIIMGCLHFVVQTTEIIANSLLGD